MGNRPLTEFSGIFAVWGKSLIAKSLIFLTNKLAPLVSSADGTPQPDRTWWRTRPRSRWDDQNAWTTRAAASRPARGRRSQYSTGCRGHRIALGLQLPNQLIYIALASADSPKRYHLGLPLLGHIGHCNYPLMDIQANERCARVRHG